MSFKNCTRCGKCCSMLPCGIATAFLDATKKPCEALETNDDGTHSCGLILRTSKYINIGKHAEWKDEFCRELFTHMVGIGMGCCTDETDKAFYEQLNEHFSFVKK